MGQVNIILAAFNGEKYIGEQLDSIIGGTFKDYMIWIFDDGSTDRTGLIIERYIKQYPDKIKYSRNTVNKGVTLNFLEGLRFAFNHRNTCVSGRKDNELPDSGIITAREKDYYMFCDQDDVWLPDKIEKTLKQMLKVEKKYHDKLPMAVFTDALVTDNKLNILYKSFNQVSRLDAKKIDLPHIMMENKLIGCTVMMNEELVRKLIHMPSNARYHDWWIALIASAFGHISYLPVATLYYRQHSNNVVGNQSFSSYVKNRLASLHDQKEVLNKTMLQAEEFYQIYNKYLNEKEKKQVYLFANLKKKPWLLRKILVVKQGYLKTGIIRNIGMLYLI
jgi:glycosyltransferase involved in cell wall biosynthesis